jgi:hypothetical protein
MVRRSGGMRLTDFITTTRTMGVGYTDGIAAMLRHDLAYDVLTRSVTPLPQDRSWRDLITLA